MGHTLFFDQLVAWVKAYAKYSTTICKSLFCILLILYPYMVLLAWLHGAGLVYLVSMYIVGYLCISFIALLLSDFTHLSICPFTLEIEYQLWHAPKWVLLPHLCHRQWRVIPIQPSGEYHWQWVLFRGDLHINWGIGLGNRVTWQMIFDVPRI